jgi:energy-coupling factor transport system substrate-specific component/cob(I)alamin adenosyltransferase
MEVEDLTKEAKKMDRLQYDKRKLSAKDIVLIGILSASITGGKMVLSAIPNVEIVTLLFMVYTVVFGIRRTLFVSIIFTTTEILLWGVHTWLLTYYIIWPLLILLTGLLSRFLTGDFTRAFLAGAFGLTFGMYFAIVEAMLYGLNYGFVYYIRGIPFDIIHGASNFIVVLMLFKPLERMLGRLAKNYTENRNAADS